ncbi:MAG: hypothetical protein V1817_04715 [Candidatus Micrarchaeota archaeon]
MHLFLLAELSSDLLFLAHQFLEIFTLVLAPILIIYAFVAYRGQYQSRSLPVLVFLAVTLGLAGVFNVMSGHALAFQGDYQSRLLALLDDLMRTVAMIALLVVVRGYVHDEITLIEKKEWLPKHLFEKQRGRQRQSKKP